MLCAHPYHCNVLHYIQIVPPPEPEGQLCDLFTFESLLTSCRLNCTELLSARGWGGGGGFRGAGGVGGTALSWPCFRVYRGKVEHPPHTPIVLVHLPVKLPRQATRMPSNQAERHW